MAAQTFFFFLGGSAGASSGTTSPRAIAASRSCFSFSFFSAAGSALRRVGNFHCAELHSWKARWAAVMFL